MKRLLTCLLAVMLLLALTPAAYADVLWEPDNNFYWKHADECTYIGRSYYANGPEGFVTLWNAPGGSTVAAQYENGFTLPVYWQYQDWGCVTVWGDEGAIDGWVPMSELYLVYDYISFEEEYGSQFRDYSGEFADFSGDTGELICWAYPNAPEPSFRMKCDADVVERLTGSGEEKSYITQVYTDPNGVCWGFVGYLFGSRNFWINLDNPTGDSVMSTGVPKADDLIASGELTAPRTPVMPSAARVPYFLVGGVAAVTLGLLGWFYGRKRRGK